MISPTKTTIDNDIASHDIAVVAKPLIRRHQNQRTIRAELTVRFPPFQLYEFPVIRNYSVVATWPSPSKDGGWRAWCVGILRTDAVPGNGRATNAFRVQIGRHWLRALRRRSQRHRLTWERMTRLIAPWLPPVSVVHTPRRASPCAPKVGAQCGSSACWDLCGGPPVRTVPTAISRFHQAACVRFAAASTHLRCPMGHEEVQAAARQSPTRATPASARCETGSEAFAHWRLGVRSRG